MPRVLAPLDTGADCSLVYGNPELFPGPAICIDGYGGKTVTVKAVSLPLGIGRLPPRTYKVYVSPVPEYILGVDVLHGLSLQTSVGEFRLRIRVVKAVTRGHAHHPPQVLPQPWRVVTVRQYRLPGGQEIGRTVLELEKAHIVRPTHSPFNSPVWPVKKPDGTWRLTVDYRELNKVPIG